MRALSSPRLPLSKLMELGLHRLHSSLDVVPAVPRRLMMNRMHLVNVWHVNSVNLMHRWPLFPGRGGGGCRGRRTRDRIELVMSIDAASVHGILDVRVLDFRLILKLQPSANQGWRRWSVRRWSPLGHCTTAPRALILLRGVFTAEARAARPTLRRCLQVWGRCQLRGRPRVSRVSRRQPRSRSTSRLRRRRGRQRLNGYEPPRLGVDRLQRGKLLAVSLVHATKLKIIGRRRKGTFSGRWLPDRTEIAEV